MRIDIFHHNPPIVRPLLYGVWLPGEGWLKATKPNSEVSACAFENRKEAADLAIKLGGSIAYIDDSIASAAVENKLKEAEMRIKSKERKPCLIYRIWSHKQSK